MGAHLRLMGLLLGIAAGMGLVGVPAFGEMRWGDAETGTTGALPGYAVVYARRHPVSGRTYAWQIIWQSGSDPRRMRVIRETPALEGWVHFGSMFGFLPSPDGRWLLVWETAVDRRTALPVSTTWRAIELPSGRQLRIGEQPGLQGVLPYWLDEHRLSLEKRKERAILDVRTGQLTGQLPGPAQEPRFFLRDIDGYADGPKEGAEWRREYLRRHFQRELDSASAALASVGSQLALDPCLHPSELLGSDSVEDMLLRAKGIIPSPSAVPGIRWRWPELAISPSGDLLARAAVLAVGTVADDDVDTAPAGSEYVFRAHLDVYRLPSGKRLGGWRLCYGDSASSRR